jgi:hypothetical protein
MREESCGVNLSNPVQELLEKGEIEDLLFLRWELFAQDSTNIT